MGALRLSPAPGAGSLVLVAVLCGCAPLQHRGLDAQSSGLPPAVELKQTPFYPQQIHHCGPAALATILDDSGADTTPAALAPQIYTPDREGSFAAEMRAAARRHKRLAYPLDPEFADLLAELAGGRPVAVMQNLGLSWYPSWHYAVAIGYDLDRREIILRSGTRRRHITDFSTFERTWRRSDYWAMLALRPGELPARPDARRYLEAAGELERLGFYSEANLAYRAAAEQWPDKPAAWMGAGNTAYRLERPDTAEDAYRRALSLNPDYAPAHNNLAQVHLDRGDLEAAEAAARAAVTQGGPLATTYRRTLNEILEAKAGRGR